MPHELPKAYDPRAIEARWAEYWVKEKLFSVETPPPTAEGDTHISQNQGDVGHQGKGEAHISQNRGNVGHPAKPVFTLLLPPPNVTGRLHMGHMLNQTEMDIIVRWHRMRGFTTLWLPGTDHAGIATQMMVERQLASEGKNRRELGREAFIARVWEWREQYGGAILDQMRRLGASVDWQREYFTMDERLSRAVREAFVRLYEAGLIYRGKYIVNWCPRCMTAISDLEVVHEEAHGQLYEIKYPVIATPAGAEAAPSGGPGGTDEFITVATTRPETMLGDTAVAVNPKDARYSHLHGKKVLLPLMQREIPIILDEVAQPEFGTGAVKVTPAHDANDYAAGLRHNLPQIEVIDDVGRMNENAGAYAGLDRYEARERVLRDLNAQGLLGKSREYVVPLGKCSRCKTVVEPRLSTQWFVAVNKKAKDGSASLGEKAIAVVTSGEVTFVPENYKTIYLNWMENLHDWCISRQLWWGHRIPAWHCAQCREITVAREAPAKCPKCGSAELAQDPDVLDTWFSSGLLPMSALGWPDETRDLEVFYPTSLLITGFDILFFWVARMIMLNCHFLPHHRQDAAIKQASGYGERRDDSVPYREVYIHALVRDAERQKMSKTKGNVIDPIDIIEQYGTDAVRFTLASMAAPGTDIAFSESRTEGYRAFANKIWNAARFLFMNVDKALPAERLAGRKFPMPLSPHDAQNRRAMGAPLEDRWITSRLNRVARQMNESLAAYRFHEAAQVIYNFFWGEFCDWYLELVKPRLAAFDRKENHQPDPAILVLATVFDSALRLLHPFMPFITEELWQALQGGDPPHKSIALAEYPQANPAVISDAVETEMAILQDLIVSVRNVRHELKVEPREKTPIEVHCDAEIRRLVEQNQGSIERLANVAGIAFTGASLAKAPGARSTARFDVRVVYEKKIDVAAERERLTKELARIEKEMSNAERQLGNPGFLAKAPAHVVEGLRKRLEELKVVREKSKRALEEL
jgi:valyl-tRNA synthetase